MTTQISSSTKAQPRPFLVILADALRSRAFTLIASGIIVLMSVALLGLSLFGTWLKTPPLDLEHRAHVHIVEVTERVGRRAGFRDNDILIALAGQDVLGKSDAELAALFERAQREAHAAVLAQGTPTEDATFSVPVVVQRKGERLAFEITQNLPETPPEETTYRAWADYGIVIEQRPDQNLPNPDGVRISLLQVWLGSSDILPTLELDNLEAGKSGFGAVRALDRWLILYPLGLVIISGLVLGWAWMRWGGKVNDYTRGIQVQPLYWRRLKITPERLLTTAVLVGLVLALLPPTWAFLSSGQWRSDLIDEYADDRDASALPDVYREVFHVREIVITADANRENAPGQQSIVRQTLLEIQKSIAIGTIQQWTLVLAVLLAATRLIVYAEADGLVTNPDRMMAVLVLTPSLVLLGIFVYGFIAQNIQYSLTDWGEQVKGAPSPFEENVTRVNIGLENYNALMTDFTEFSFRNSLVNTFFFTILFLGAALFMGFLLAFLVDQKVWGENIFRTIFLFPMSLSLVVTGTVWNWLLQPRGGLNQLPQVITSAEIFGVRLFPESWQAEPLQYQWIASRNVIYQFTWEEAQAFVYLGLALFGVVAFNYAVRASERAMTWTTLFAVALWLFYVSGWWRDIWPPLDLPMNEPIKGYNVALTGAILAATWQMAGYVMALFLAGIRGVSDELREAARVDGCAEWQVYLYIVLPSLRPIVLSAVIILGHISLKVFDLIFALNGPDVENTKVPGIVLYTMAFRGNRLAMGSAVAVVMLLLVSLVIVPYLWSNSRQQRVESH